MAAIALKWQEEMAENERLENLAAEKAAAAVAEEKRKEEEAKRLADEAAAKAKAEADKKEEERLA